METLTRPQISTEPPPNWEELQEKFGVSWKNTIVTYAPYVHVANGYLSYDLEVHEGVHLKQQGDDPDSWWFRYMREPAFRLEQEVQAYRAQYKAFKKNIKDRNQLFNALNKIASDLSGKMYGYIISYNEAIRRIKNANHN